jgi:hypothetical protein
MTSEQGNEDIEDFKIKEEGLEVKDEPRTPRFSPLTDIEDLVPGCAVGVGRSGCIHFIDTNE